MSWIDILAAIILFFSFIGGLKEGAVKNLFSLLVLLLAIPLAGLYYYLVATILAFLPGTGWENFLGFFITLAVISLILHLIFLIPRKLAQKVWGEGVLFRLLGGGINLLNASIGMVVFTLALGAYPVVEWLEQTVTGSSVLAWLVAHLGFVAAMLPEAFRSAASLIVAL